MATIDASQRVRAVARVGAQPAPDLEPATLRRRGRPGHLGPVSALRIVFLELAVVLALVAWRQPSWARPAELAVAVAIPVVAFARYRGRWWTERMVLRARYRRRRVSARLLADDRRLTALRDLAPDLTVETVDGPAGGRLGVGRDGAGWFATVALTQPRGVRGEALPLPPLDQLSRALAEAEQPGGVVQVVVHTVPGSSAAAAQPCVESYQELLRPLGGDAAPVSVGEQLCWVSVRIEARAIAEIAVTSPEAIAEVPAVLSALVRRVGNVLKRTGVAYQVLDADALLDALVLSLGVEVTAAGTDRRRAVESWRGWRAAEVEQRCFWVRSWPSLAACGPLLAELYRSPAAFSSLSIAMRPAPAGTEFRCLARVGDAPGGIGAAVTGLRSAARRHGGHLFALDGEQAPAVYATAPTGGGAL
jgi:type VII secretion protein EccE